MFRLGITGGIGSGKSTVCKVFRVFGIPVFSADRSAREIMDTDNSLKKELNNIIGKDVYTDGFLNREMMAGLIFNDTELLGRVNKLVHPYVIRAFDQWCNSVTSRYAIFEAAILFESGAVSYTDRSLAVIAPLEERLMRVMERNIISREQVEERMRNQLPESELISRADFLISNNEDELIIPQVIRINNELLTIINEKD